MSPRSPKHPPLNPVQRWNMALVTLASAVYGCLLIWAPHTDNASSIHLAPWVTLVLSLSILGLLVFSWLAGFYAWLQLDRYANRLSHGRRRQAFRQMAGGVRLLATGLIISILLNATKPFFAQDAGLTTVVTQVNYYIIILFPFLGFLWLRQGSKYLAAAAQTAMSLGTKLLTITPPVLLLGGFYIFLALTNSTPETLILLSGPTGFLVLPTNIILVVGSWVLGLLAALNIERSTHHGTINTRPLVRLYNGILLMTGGFIILDAVMSLGNTRLLALPLSVTLILVYAFVLVIALGFWSIAVSGGQLSVEDQARADGHPA